MKQFPSMEKLVLEHKRVFVRKLYVVILAQLSTIIQERFT